MFIRLERNRLAYPCGVTPGFDPTHPASFGACFSVVNLGGGFVNLLNGTGQDSSAAVTQAVHGALGPCDHFAGAGIVNVSKLTFPSSLATYTYAAIFVPDTVVGNVDVCGFGNGSNGLDILRVGAVLRVDYPGVSSVSSGLSMAAGVPYLAVISRNATPNHNFMLVRLDTGSILTATSASANIGSTPTLRLTIGSGGFGNFDGFISSLMFSTVYLSMPQLIAWAADPWSFWYPRRDAMLVGAAAAAFKAYWAQQNNLPVIGAGAY